MKAGYTECGGVGTVWCSGLPRYGYAISTSPPEVKLALLHLYDVDLGPVQPCHEIRGVLSLSARLAGVDVHVET